MKPHQFRIKTSAHLKVRNQTWFQTKLHQKCSLSNREHTFGKFPSSCQYFVCVDLPHKVCIWDHVTSIRFSHPTLLKHAFDAATKIWDKYVSARFSCEKRGLSPPVMYYSFSVFVLLPLGHRTKDLRYHIRRHGLYSSLSSFSRYFTR